MGKKSSKKSKVTIDPELTRQLEEVDEDVPVQAVFTLTTPAGEKYRSNDSTAEAVEKIVDQAKSAAKTTSAEVKVFGNLQSFAVSAPASMVRSMLGHRDIASAMANEQKEDLLIRPVPSKTSSTSKAGKKTKKKTTTKAKKKSTKKKSTKKKSGAMAKSSKRKSTSKSRKRK